MTVKKVLFAIYTVIIGILGVFFVPCNLVYGYGGKLEIISAEFVPIWKLIDKTQLINGNYARYELILSRVLYTFAIIALIMFLVYLVFDKTDNRKNI
ncbi:MAG: hypothetical protein E7255_08150 [Lachnospiraceae bacterium]|nr:hypothetical protein [Lachnospiraceae bacterium]